MGYKIEIDDGRIPVTINNHRKEEIGVIYINPSDFNILTRLEEVKKNMEKIPDFKEDITGDSVIEADRYVREQIDYLFGDKVSDTVFKNQHSMSTLKGVTLVERLIEGLTPVIEQIITKEVKSSEERMKKYTSAYGNDEK